MPLKKTIKRARKDKREGKSASTQAGEFVREEIENIRKGKHGVRNVRQAIAIGLSMARRAGVKLPAPEKGKAPEKTRQQAKRELKRAASGPKKPSPKRSRAALKALKRESTRPASHKSLARHAATAASRRTAADRSASARKAARTKGPAVRSAAARKAARTRAGS
jgi:hypothetical protein